MFNVNRKSNHMRTVNFSVDVNDSIVSKRVRVKAFKSADSNECHTSLKYFDSVHELQCITYPNRKTQDKWNLRTFQAHTIILRWLAPKQTTKKLNGILTEFGLLRFYYYLKPDHVTLLLWIYKRNSTQQNNRTQSWHSPKMYESFSWPILENRGRVWSGVRRGHRTFRVWNHLEHWSFYLTVIIRIKNVTTTWNELDDDII